MAPASLAAFPDEILRNIAKDFCDHCRAPKSRLGSPLANSTAFNGHRDSHDPAANQPGSAVSHNGSSQGIRCLYSLSLVSRKLRSVAQPILFHEFALGCGDTWEQSSLLNWSGRLTAYMNTIAIRPDLALWAKKVYIHPLLIENTNRDEALATFRRCGQGLGIRIPQAWTPSTWTLGPNQRPTDISLEFLQMQLLTMLLFLLPNMEQLTLPTTHEIIFYRMPGLALLTGPGHTNTSVRMLDLAPVPKVRMNSSISHHMSTEALGILDLCRDIQTLSLDNCVLGEWNIPKNPLRNLRVLRIMHGSATEEQLVLLLDALGCTHLEHFAYEAGFPRPDRDPEHFQPPSLVGYLRKRCKSKLTSFHLDFRRLGPAAKQGTAGMMPPMRDFSALKHLFISSQEVYRDADAHIPETTVNDNQRLFSLLPDRLETLEFAGDSPIAAPRLATGLRALCERMTSGRFPRLTRIRGDDEQNLDAYSFGERFARLGRNFEYAYRSFSEETAWGGASAREKSDDAR